MHFCPKHKHFVAVLQFVYTPHCYISENNNVSQTAIDCWLQTSILKFSVFLIVHAFNHIGASEFIKHCSKKAQD